MTSDNTMPPPPKHDLTNDGPERLSLQSRDLTADRVAQLKTLFPEVFREDEIDFDALRRSLGGPDGRAGPGALRTDLAGQGRLHADHPAAVAWHPDPDREQSVDFDTTGNVVIEATISRF